MSNYIKRLFVFGSVLCTLFCGAVIEINKAQRTSITIGSKIDTESQILANILKIIIQRQTKLKVNHLEALDGTWVCFNALLVGDIDLYVEYTGTALSAILKEDLKRDSAFIKDAFAKRYDIAWLEPLGFENSYALFSKNNPICKFSELTYADITLGVDPEFSARDECKSIIDAYGVTPEIMEQGLLFLSNHDVIVSASTNARTKDYKRLEDDNRLFPSYHPSPIARQAVIKRYPQLKAALLSCKNLVTENEMLRMNIEVDINHQKPYDVALAYIKSKDLF